MTAFLSLTLMAGCGQDILQSCLSPRGRGPAERDGVRDGGGGQDGGAGRPDTCTYSLGVEYPASYDWVRDSAPEAADCRLVVFRKQKRILELAAGPASGLSPDPDMNRLINGHLYSDLDLPEHSGVCRDGRELFRYEGREMNMGFVLSGDDVYTLGQSRSGKGISFRKNGVCLFEDSEGCLRRQDVAGGGPEGLLGDSGGSLSFWYSGNGRTYLVVDGERRTVDLPGEITGVICVSLIDGEIWTVGTTAESRERPVLFHNGKSVRLGSDTPTVSVSGIIGCRIFKSGDSVFVSETHCFHAGRGSQACLWKEDGSLVSSGLDIVGFWTDSDGKTAWVKTDGDGIVSAWHYGGTERTMQEKEQLVAYSCVAYKDGLLCMCTSPPDRMLSPRLRLGDKTLALMLNGYVSCVELSVSRQ